MIYSKMIRNTAIASILMGFLSLSVVPINAMTFQSSVSIDPWPDPSAASSELETLNLSVATPMTATSGAIVTLGIQGDFNGLNEFLDITVETFSLGRIFDGIDGNDGFDLAGDSPGSAILTNVIELSAFIPLATLSTLIADGFLNFGFIPTEANQPGQGVPASLSLSVSFENDDISAVPVPAALPLFGTGLAIMGFMGWRRKRKAA